MVRKAIVLAAGFGSRLRPFTCVTPKPLLPVWGVSLLARIVDHLRELGVDDIVVNCHYLAEQVETWCRENGCRAVCEPEILGTGGVLNPLREWIGGDQFYLVNGDIVVENAPRLALKPGEIAVCAVTEDGPRTIEVEPESGFVTNWKSDDAGFPGTFTYCGYALLNADILKYVEPTGFSTIVQAYGRAMNDGRFVRAVNSSGMMWTDAGTIDSYIALNCDERENGFAAFPQLRAAGFTGDIEFLGARGSDRVFFRSGDRVAILYDDAKRGENAKYAGHAKWLKDHGVGVPEVIADLPDAKTLVLEWAGLSRSLAFDDYVKVVEALAAFSRLGDAARTELPLEPAFGPELYRWEHELFVEHLLGARYRSALTDAVRRDLDTVSERLAHEPVSLVHRDFQSTNILWKNGSPRFIDFQGMRLGPAAYDLASLLCDPYVKPLTDAERTALVRLFALRMEQPGLEDVFPFAAVQRLVQCLGAYGRLASVGQPQFLAHVPQALSNLLAAADDAGLDALGALAEDLIAQEDRIRRPHGDDADDCDCRCHSHGEDDRGNRESGEE